MITIKSRSNFILLEIFALGQQSKKGTALR